MAKQRQSAQAIQRWILDQVQQQPGCQGFRHPFHVVAAPESGPGEWEITGPQPSGPCEHEFVQKADEAHKRFSLG